MSIAVSMKPAARALLAGALAGCALLLAPAAAFAQFEKAQLWQIMPGTPVAELPARLLDPHCGTNGGPPSTRLSSFADFATCRADPATGLHEVWFTENDEAEYVSRAYRAQMDMYGPSAVNVLYNHRVIYSLLIDGAGIVQGYRIVTDPREDAMARFDAEYLGDAMRGLYGYGLFQCAELPAGDGETPIEGRFVKQNCVATLADGRHIRIERRFFYKRGQFGIDPLTGVGTVNQFESTARVEVIAASLVPAPAPPAAPAPAAAAP
ncbi:MAG: hypothetical protein IT535_05340 [Bauldia sp.]|nr:hypothetical protein [Bauldia sp.]